MKVKIKEWIEKVTTFMSVARPIVELRTFSIPTRSSGWYYTQSIDVSLNGYTPVSVGFASNQAATNVFNCSLDGNTVSYGRSVGTSGNTLASNSAKLFVVYVKDSLVGGVVRRFFNLLSSRRAVMA